MSAAKKNDRTGRAKAWQSMRILRRFTVADLQTTAEMGCKNAYRFCQRLAEAGYLSVTKRGTRTFYALVRDTGPLCPVLSHDGTVIDRNEKTSGEVAR